LYSSCLGLKHLLLLVLETLGLRDREKDHARRRREVLNGKTPAEACGIKVRGSNKWLTLIQNASEQKLNR
jgi:hypothetical protein